MSVAIGSSVAVEALIPSLEEPLAGEYHQAVQACQLVRPESPGHGEPNRSQPEFRELIAMFNVDMRRFTVLAAVEKAAESRDVRYRWHAALSALPVNKSSP